METSAPRPSRRRGDRAPHSSLGPAHSGRIGTSLTLALCALGLGTLAACGGMAVRPAGTAQPAGTGTGTRHGHGTGTGTGTGQPAGTALSTRAAAHRALLGPISVSFISPSTGWLLAVEPCGGPACTSLRMRKTTDGGRRWLAVNAPPARLSSWPPGIDDAPTGPPGAVSSVTFANRSDGWAYGPGLWSTHDGGATWRRVSTHGLPVTSLATAGGRAIAVFSRCRPPQPTCAGFRVYSSPVSADGWRPVPGASGAGLGTVAASGRDGYLSAVPIGRDGLIASRRPVLLLAGPVTGAARWRRRPVPCRSARTGAGDFGAPIAAARGGILVLACAGEPSGGGQLKRAYLSADRGRSWRALANPSVDGYLGGVAVTAAGTIFWSGPRSAVWISDNHGRGWHTSGSLDRADNGGGGLIVEMTTDRDGFVIADDLNPAGQIWLTRDGGRTWQPTTVR